MRGLTRISTKDMSREEWLELRRRTIGGSDAAAIVGLSKWASPYSVWAEKTGRLPPAEDNEAMRQGRDLEDYVAQRWAEATGKKVRRLPEMIYNPAYPFAHANIDRLVVGENAGLECKTTGALDVSEFEGSEFPARYYVQCVHYLAVTGADRWYLAVVVFGRGFYAFTLERKDVEDEIAALMDAERDFMRYIETDTPPPADGSEATKTALTTLYSDSEEITTELFGRQSVFEELLALKEQKKRIEEAIREQENIIKGDMREAERGYCGDYSARWKVQKRSMLDVDKLKAEHPEIDFEKYNKVTTSRPFKVTKNEEVA